MWLFKWIVYILLSGKMIELWKDEEVVIIYKIWDMCDCMWFYLIYVSFNYFYGNGLL